MFTFRQAPRGIPVQPPPGWKPRLNPAWRAVSIAASLTLIVLLAATLGWLVIDPGSGRGPRPPIWALLATPPTSDTEPEPAPAEEEPAKQQPTPEEKDPPRPVENKTPPAEKKKRPEKTPPAEEKKAPPPEKKPAEPPPPEKIPVPVEPPMGTLTYKKDVAPILERACIRCHNANKQQGGINISTYDDVLAQVMPGKPDSSDLLNVIVNDQMPPGAPNAVSAAERKKLRDWIAQGAKP